MSLKRRVRAIQRAIAPSDGECPACRYTPGDPIKIQIDPDDCDEPAYVCPECGERRIITIEIDDPRGAEVS